MSPTRGQQLKRLRQDRGWTLDYVAKKIHVDKTALSKYENDKRNASEATLRALAALYDVDLAVLLNLGTTTKTAKVYRVKTPLVRGYTRQTAVLLAAMFLGGAVFMWTEAAFALLVAVFFLTAVTVRAVWTIAFGHTRPEHVIKIHDGETLYIEHPMSNTSIKRRQNQELMILPWLLFTLALLFSMIAPMLDSVLDRTIWGLLFFTHLAWLAVRGVLILMRNGEKKTVPYDDTDRFINTFAIRFYHILATPTALLLMAVYPLADHLDGTVRLAYSVLVVAYALASQAYAFDKIHFAKGYRLAKGIDNPSTN